MRALNRSEVPQGRAPSRAAPRKPEETGGRPLPSRGNPARLARADLAEALAEPTTSEAANCLEAAADIARNGHARAALRVAEHAVKVLHALEALRATARQGDTGDTRGSA